MCHLGHNKAGFSKRSDTRHEQYIFLSPTFPPWTRKLISSHCFFFSSFFSVFLYMNLIEGGIVKSTVCLCRENLGFSRTAQIHMDRFIPNSFSFAPFSHIFFKNLIFFLSSSVGPGNTSRTMQSVYPPPPPPPPASCNTFIHYFCFEWLHHVQLCPSQTRSHSR